MERNQQRLEWFNTPLIVRSVLTNFGHQKLLSFSLINKTWNYEAKSLLKARKTTTAKLGTEWSSTDSSGRPRSSLDSFMIAPMSSQLTAGYSTWPSAKPGDPKGCEKLLEFTRIVQGMRVIPFAHLSINIILNHCGSCPPLDEAVINQISSQVSLIGLKLAVYKLPQHMEEAARNESQTNSCNAVRSVEPVLSANAHQLVDLSVLVAGISSESVLNPKFISKLAVAGFPQLKTLTFDYFESSNRPSRSELTCFRKIVDGAPNLEEFHVQHSQFNDPRDLLDAEDDAWLEMVLSTVLEDTKALLVCSQILFVTLSLSRECLSRIAVRHVVLQAGLRENVDPELIQSVLHNSQRTLQDADLDIHSLVTLFRGQSSFLKLAKLSLSVRLAYIKHQLPSFFKRVFCRRVWKERFPNLKELTISRGGSEPSDDINHALPANGNERVEGRDWGIDIERIVITTQSHVPMRTDDDADELACIFELFPNVKEFELGKPGKQIDAPLCGIHPEEAVELRTKSVTYLRDVHIVPVRPSIANLTNLRTLIFNSVDEFNSYEDTISRIAAALCFSRMPHLTIQLRIHTWRSTTTRLVTLWRNGNRC